MNVVGALLGGLLACAGGAALCAVLLRDDPPGRCRALAAVGLLAAAWVVAVLLLGRR